MKTVSTCCIVLTLLAACPSSWAQLTNMSQDDMMCLGLCAVENGLGVEDMDAIDKISDSCSTNKDFSNCLKTKCTDQVNMICDFAEGCSDVVEKFTKLGDSTVEPSMKEQCSVLVKGSKCIYYLVKLMPSLGKVIATDFELERSLVKKTGSKECTTVVDTMIGYFDGRINEDKFKSIMTSNGNALGKRQLKHLYRH